MSYDLLCGDAIDTLRGLETGSVQVCVTSPPYYQLRSYLDAGHPDKPLELGGEDSPVAYIARLVAVFGEVWRVLRPDGTLWVNIGDGYCNRSVRRADGMRTVIKDYAEDAGMPDWKEYAARGEARYSSHYAQFGIKEKSLFLIPQRFAIAMVDTGWICRSAITWVKGSAMPESVADRPTSATEMIYLFAKQPTYYYDAMAIAEPTVKGAAGSTFTAVLPAVNGMGRTGQGERVEVATRNARNWWLLNNPGSDLEHYAGFPEALPTRCLLAGSSPRACEHCGAPWRRVVETESRPNAPSLIGKYNGEGVHRTVSGGVSQDGRARLERGWAPTCSHPNQGTGKCTVLDPFAGSGTSGVAALKHGRRFVGIDLSERYIDMARRRIDASLCAANVLDRPRIRPVDGQLALFGETS